MCSVQASASEAGGWAVPAAGMEGVEMDRLVEVAQSAADAAGEVLRKYFRQRFEIIDKEDHSACPPPRFYLYAFFEGDRS
jgi:inositol-phosphate phosphatase/L-galactose 1-phosphate phosphatase/histidinol-phosphatase